MLRDVLPPRTLEECRKTFSRFVNDTIKKNGKHSPAKPDGLLALDDAPSSAWDNGETIHGSWHVPWVVQHRNHLPAAVVMSELITSWAWRIIERICDSENIMVMFGLCLARHNIDQNLHIGVHQDATAVNPEVPLSIWIPLQEVRPKHHSGLGFIIPSPGHVLPAGPNNDIGEDYAYSNMNNMWVPHYHPGDLTIHSRFSPHFTTGYGTMTDRYSLEIRLWAREDSLIKYGDPSIMVSRRDDVPVISETRCSMGVGAHGFLASTALLAMQATTAKTKSTKPQEPALSGGVTRALRNMTRRIVAGASS
jgi:hypothetical protein